MSKAIRSTTTVTVSALVGVAIALVALPQSIAGEDEQTADTHHSRAVFYLTHRPNGSQCASLRDRTQRRGVTDDDVATLGKVTEQVVKKLAGRDITLDLSFNCCPEGFSEVGLKARDPIPAPSWLTSKKPNQSRRPQMYPEVVCLQD